MEATDHVESRSYWWCALMGPKGEATIGSPMEIQVKPDLRSCVFTLTVMGRFNLDPVMWSRMDTSPQGARAIAMRIYEATDPLSAERIKRKDYEYDLRKARSVSAASVESPAWMST